MRLEVEAELMDLLDQKSWKEKQQEYQHTELSNVAWPQQCTWAPWVTPEHVPQYALGHTPSAHAADAQSNVWVWKDAARDNAQSHVANPLVSASASSSSSSSSSSSYLGYGRLRS